MKTVFIHPERCVGCKQCEAACAVAHSQTKNLFLSVFETPAPKARIHAEHGLTLATAFPNKCRHCNPAPCQYTCPTGAISRSQSYPEIVLIDDSKCIACGMCAVVCPFDVITYHPVAAAPERNSVAVKCDQCIERQMAEQIPACVEVCKVNALEFGEINELVKTARTRYSEAVSIAVGQVTKEPAMLPQSLQSWRTWGAAVESVNADGKKGA